MNGNSEAESPEDDSAPIPMPPEIIPFLREQTRYLHERLESRLDFSVHFASRTAYRRLLERFYGFYAPLESCLALPARRADWDALHIDFAARQKAPRLQADLRALGLSADAVARLPTCSALPSPQTPGELAGCAYVVEGATLGGQIIGRMLHTALELPPNTPGAQFFAGYGDENGAQWARFRRSIDSFAAREEARCAGEGARIAMQAAACACQTFAAMESWLLPETAQANSCDKNG